MTRAWMAAVAVAVVLGCSGPSEKLHDGIFTAAEWEKVNALSPLPAAPPVKSNKYADNPKAAELGQALFFDKKFSGPILVDNSDLGAKGETQRLNCTACHTPVSGFADGRSKTETSTGAGLLVGRNTLGLTNLGFYEWSSWTGFIDTMWGHAILAGPECVNCLNSSRLAVGRRLWEKYRVPYKEVFGEELPDDLDPAKPDEADGGRRFPLLAPAQYPLGKPSAPDGGVWVKMSAADQELMNRAMANYGKAIEAYLRKLVSKDSAFDKYVAGDANALSASAKNGLKLFVGKAACVECHSGPNFSDNKYHNDATAERRTADGGMRVDNGQFDGINAARSRNRLWSGDGPYSDEKTGLVNNLPVQADGGAPENTRGLFRTKALRSVALTGPYMHTGSLKTLEEVVRQYNEGGAPDGTFIGTRDPLLVPLNLTDSEVLDLVEFLKSLNGAELPSSLLMDTSAN